jgi:hypothetical protein
MAENDRIHRYLDGELPLEALSPEERMEAERHEALAEAVTRRERPALGDLSQAVMRRIEALEAVPPEPRRDRWSTRWMAWLWRPRPVTIRVRPALAGAAALVVLAAGALLPSLRDAAPAQDEANRVFIQFRLDVADVEHVALAGDFTEWKPVHALHQTGPGVWSVTVALDPGIHDYAFLVDGERWMTDPLAARVDDGFGGVNSRVAVLVPERRRSS